VTRDVDWLIGWCVGWFQSWPCVRFTLQQDLPIFLKQNFNKNLTRRRNSTRREYEISQRRAVTARTVLVLVIQRFTRFYGVGVTIIPASTAKGNDGANDHDECRNHTHGR